MDRDCSEEESEEKETEKMQKKKKPQRSWAGAQPERERTNEESRQQARDWKSARTKRKNCDLFAKYGVKWSAFFELENFDIVRACVGDQMHQLFLGVTTEQSDFFG